MSNDSAHYRRQAVVQHAAAAEATLANVRERCERAAATWDQMADRAERAEQRQADRREQADARMVVIAAAE